MASRPFLLPALFSVILGVSLYFLFAFFTPREFRLNGPGYAVLAVDENRDDRQIRDLLAGLGLADLISESSQEVSVDDFGSVRKIPLDFWHDEIEAFDPRNDGYAERLKSFFVREGKRFFFIPLNDSSGNKASGLNKQLVRAFGEMPFTLSIMGRRTSSLWYILLLAAACGAVLCFSRSARLFVFVLPVLPVLGFCGSSAFVPAAALAGIWALLKAPLTEVYAARHYGRASLYAGTGFRGIRERLRPFRVNCLLALLFLLFFAVFSIAAGFAPVPLAALCLSFFTLYFLSFRGEAERSRKNRHVLFVPVLLHPFSARTFSLSPFLLPFAAASALALFPGIFNVSPAREGGAHSRYIITAEDYHRHVAFQSAFSYRSLNQNTSGHGALNQEEYLRYHLGEDGLIAGSTGFSGIPAAFGREAHTGQVSDPPPFPLEKLMDFLIEYTKPGMADETVKPREWIFVAILFLACVPDLLRKRRGKKNNVFYFGDKRMAA